MSSLCPILFASHTHASVNTVHYISGVRDRTLLLTDTRKSFTLRIGATAKNGYREIN